MRAEFVHLSTPENRRVRVIVSVVREPDGGFAIQGFELTKTYAPEHFSRVLEKHGFDEAEARIQIEDQLERLAEREKEKVL